MTRINLTLTLIFLMLHHGSCHDPVPERCPAQTNDDNGSGSGERSLSQDSRCIPYGEAVSTFIYSECVPFIPEGKCHFFDYGTDFIALQGTVERLVTYIHMQSESGYCDELVISYMCNYVYPGCNAAQEVPVGICSNECYKLAAGGKCSVTFQELESAATLLNMFRIDSDCENTFLGGHNLNFTTNSTDCFHISETVRVNTTQHKTESLPLEWIIPVGVIVPLFLMVFIVLLSILVTCKRRRKRQQLESSFRSNALHTGYFQSNNLSPIPTMNRYHPTTHLRENYTMGNAYQLREVIMKSKECEDTSDDLPLFQLLSEDVDRLGDSLRDVLIPFKQLSFKKEIGQGAFGRVYRGLYARSLDDGMNGKLINVAIKTIKDSQGQDAYKNTRDFVEESALMHTFNHPNVLGLVGISLDENSSPYIVLPYMENGDLRTFLKNKREVATKSTDTGYPEGLQYDMLVRICHEVAMGMEYLASRKLVHRDLAARNCMVDGNISIRVADFGLTRDIYETDYYMQQPNAKIPVKWMSPESLHDRINNERTDVWAYGVTCWEVFSLGRTPYPTVTNHEMLEYLERGNRLKRPALCSDEMYALMKRCWLQHPCDRPLFAQIVEMFDGYIIPESCTPTIGNARYKVHIKAGSSEESLLESIVTELKHTPAKNFERDLENAGNEEEEQAMARKMSQESLGSYYIKMNPILESVASCGMNFGSYQYEQMVREFPLIHSLSREQLTEGSTVIGNPHRWSNL